ncbi:FAD-binding oxidoreductase [Actinocorallia sp. A-T 12471]|uniref:FAD-binding oxidoreductase n=1 Tax=Actinocorallia sp. A-T 12471 TaxID=3089813 RepID=UPI0029D2EF94|nr:FAD-binding oxidoreductase [Actinocorallia sp. A-T 12471]MDX6742414.1 FAD-binding oxidoreductase [Actinocorallia sp. A-T 12471]
MIQGFEGLLVRPQDAEYESGRVLWNRVHEGRPRLIARCASELDVARAIRYAREEGLALSVRSGGHNFAGFSLTDGGLLIDARGLRGVRIEPGRVGLGAGLRWGDVDAALAPEGLITPGGSVSKVGVAGFSLGTGLGWLGRRHGLTGDNLVGATVVTAAGETLRVSAEEHPELFWALRGGGGGFCVVTEFRALTHPLPTPVAGTLIRPLDGSARVLTRLLEVTAAAPATFTWAAVLTCAPPDPALPPSLRGRPVMLVPVLSTGPDAALVEEVRRVVGAEIDTVGPSPFAAFQTASDGAAPEGLRWDVRSEWLTGLDAAAIEHAVGMAGRLPSPLSNVLFRPLGGAIAAPDAPDTPFSFRAAGFLVEVIANWAEGEGKAERAWMTEAWEGLRRLSAGGPDVNHLGVGEDVTRARTAYSPDALARLDAVRAAYDPEGVFPSPLLTP